MAVDLQQFSGKKLDLSQFSKKKTSFFDRIKSTGTEIVESVGKGVERGKEAAGKFGNAFEALGDKTAPLSGRLLEAGGEVGKGLTKAALGVAETSGGILASPLTGGFKTEIEPAIESGIKKILDTRNPDQLVMIEQLKDFIGGVDETAKEGGLALTEFLGVKGVSKAAPLIKQGVKKGVKEGVEATGKGLVKAGEAVEDTAKKGFAEQAKKIAVPELEDLGMRQRQDIAKRVTENRFGGRSIVPDSREGASIKEVERLLNEGKIKASDSSVKQINVLDNEITKLSTGLENGLKKNPSGTLTKESFDSLMDDVQGALAENITITGDAEKSVQKLIAQARKEVDGLGELEALDILRVRKSIDEFVRSQKGSKIFDPATENALSIAVRELRQTLNAQAADLAPTAKIKDQLRQQSALFDVVDNVSNKFAKESAGRVGRILQNIQSSTGIPRTEIIETLGLAGAIGAGSIGLSVGGALAPLLGTALVLTSTGRVIMSPQLRRGVGKLLKKVGSATERNKILKDIESLTD